MFDHCEIHSSGPGYLTAESRTVPDGPQGFVFYHCRLTAEPKLRGIYLGRPWRAYSRVVYHRLLDGRSHPPRGLEQLGQAGRREDRMVRRVRLRRARRERSARVKWARPMTAAEADQFRPEVFLRGDDGWNPAALHL